MNDFVLGPLREATAERLSRLPSKRIGNGPCSCWVCVHSAVPVHR